MSFVGAIAALVFSEIVLPIRQSFLEDVAKDIATMGYVGAMRQVGVSQCGAPFERSLYL